MASILFVVFSIFFLPLIISSSEYVSNSNDNNNDNNVNNGNNNNNRKNNNKYYHSKYYNNDKQRLFDPSESDESFEDKESPCGYPCYQCPEVTCPAGVNPVTDGCGCCPMCSRQQGDLCTLFDKCDEQKSLYCDMNVDGGNRGICRAKNGRSCNVSGRIINDGQHYKPNCSLTCFCQDGRYACSTLCPQELRSPSPTHCKDAQLIAIKDRCCKEWVCPHPHNLINVEDPLLSNQYVNNERGCKKQVTQWSACDKPCGYGESVRISNDNERCQADKEIRICFIRPCGSDLSSEIGKGKKQNSTEGGGPSRKKSCKATLESKVAMKLQYEGCSSVASYMLRFCAQCKKCCGPDNPETRAVEMICEGGKRMHRDFMFIEKCVCFKSNQNCPFE